MRINRLTLHNYGIYAGESSLDFTSKKPVILIGGMNGRGKTTLLEAVLFALYGRRSFAVSESGLSYPQYLKERINSKNGNEMAMVSLEFVVQSELADTTYCVIREWSSKTERPSVKTTVFKEGRHDPMLSENWDYFIEDMLSCVIAPFFFFDGEKVSKLASSDDDTYMTEAIKSLLGINIIDTAINDVQRIVTAKQKNIANSFAISVIEEFDSELKTIDRALKKTKEEIGLLDATRIQLAHKLKNAEDKFLSMGGSLALNRERMLKKQNRFYDELIALNTQLLDMVAGELPLLMVLPLLKNIIATAREEKKQQQIAATIEQLPELLCGYEQQGKTSFNIDGFIQYIKSHMNSDKPVYNLSDIGLYKAQSLSGLLPGKRLSVINIVAKRNKLYIKKKEIDQYLSVNIDEKATDKTYEVILCLTAELATINEQLRIKREFELSCKAKYEDLMLKKARRIEEAVKNIETIDDEKRILKYAGYSIDVLQEYRTRLQSQKVSHLAATMTGCFKQLVSKKGLISCIKIDERDLSLSYISGAGKEITYESFSAGEKQLLVIAMLWALGTCSKKKFPVIIDTPLARLDSIHRKALVKHYFPEVSEQVILLSTDEEINKGLYKQLLPYIGKEYTLQYNETLNQAIIEPGYFESIAQ